MTTNSDDTLEHFARQDAQALQAYLAATDERNLDAANRLHIRHTAIRDCIELVEWSEREKTA